MVKNRLVYGTRKGAWYLVDANDRDYDAGIRIEEFNRIGAAAAQARYLSAVVVNKPGGAK